MLDIGWSELLVIGALALIVVGPKDLPQLLRTLGRYAAQARGMAREFQRSMEDAAREADLSEMKELKDAARELRDVGRLPQQKVGTARKSPTKPPAPATKGPAAASAKAAPAAKAETSSAAPPPEAAPAKPPPQAAPAKPPPEAAPVKPSKTESA